MRDGFAGATVLVVGDLMLDRYVYGTVHRISPEAPVPVLTIAGERTVAGGAGNVIMNIAGLRARAIAAGVVGDDASGQCLKEILTAKGVDTRAVITAALRPTTSKTRVMCDSHQIVRMDAEVSDPLDPVVEQRLWEEVIKALDGCIDAVVLSDYAKGVCGVTFTKLVISECRKRQIPVLVDPKRTDCSPYAGATFITPNLKEFKITLGAMGIGEQDPEAAGQVLRQKLEAKFLLVTQGAGGMTLYSAGARHHFPAVAEEVFDVSGAGDTVIATIAAATASGVDPLEAVKLANLAASIVVRHAGTAPICWEELKEHVERSS